MSRSAKSSMNSQKDASSLYLEALAHAEKLVEGQPPEEDKSPWRKWAREVVGYEVKTLGPREERAPRLTKYADGAGDRFLAVMKVIEATETRLKNGDGGPSSSGESEPEPEPDEVSMTRRSTRRSGDHAAAANGNAEQAKKGQQPAESPHAMISAPNLTDAQRTINYDVPCSRCARAGIACAGKEGRACFTCRAHRQGCDLSSRASRERAKANTSVREGEDQGSVSTTESGVRSKKGKSEERTAGGDANHGKRQNAESESNLVNTQGARPRRAATLINNWRVGSPKTVAQLRETGSSSSSLRKRRATDADLSIATSVPPGPSPLKKARSNMRREEDRASDEREFDREEVRDALLLCEAAFRQLRKALRF